MSQDRAQLPLEALFDVPVEVVVELGRRRMKVSEILGLTEGSVVKLEKVVGEPVDVLVNGRPVAKGEVVVVNDRFAVRLTEVVEEEEEA